MSYKGDVLIVLGVILIVITFIMGYSLYNSAKQIQLTQQNNISGNNITESFNQFVNNLNYTLTGPISDAIQIIILFLFGSIGYKIADLGIRINSLDDKEAIQKQKAK
ncbi:MAG: hypothetical protein ACP5M9_04435 [Candidatus Micrarchaeia archaeon]